MIHQRHRQTDRRTDDMRSQDRTLHYSALRGKNWWSAIGRVVFELFLCEWTDRQTASDRQTNILMTVLRTPPDGEVITGLSLHTCMRISEGGGKLNRHNSNLPSYWWCRLLVCDLCVSLTSPSTEFLLRQVPLRSSTSLLTSSFTIVIFYQRDFTYSTFIIVELLQ